LYFLFFDCFAVCSTLNHRRFLDRQSLGARTATAKKKSLIEIVA